MHRRAELKDLSNKHLTVLPHHSVNSTKSKECPISLPSQENICTEWRRSTPLKADSTVPILLLARKAPTPDRVHITPIKQPDRGLHPEPWTPTANLKMLISAASPDIRDREMKKMLFRPIENEKENVLGPEKAVDVEEEDTCQVVH